jgi:nucleoside-triphosphatase
MRISNIFVTGSIHVGKSTVINSVIKALPGWRINGFRTTPIFEEKKRSGFVFESLDGYRECFAHIDLNTRNKYDIYHYDLTIFNDFGVRTLEKALTESDLIIMDEIGAMEREARKFQKALKKCLDSPIFVLGAFQKRARWFQDFVQPREDTKIFMVDESNRSTVSQSIKPFVIK